MIELEKLFYVNNGNDLELCYQTKSEDGIAFVSRTENNNGISARIEEIDNLKPFSPSVITVSLGGSVMESFVQEEPFYTGYHIRVLKPKKPMSIVEMQFYCMCIRANKFKYSFGLQANKTIESLLLPSIDELPPWVHSKQMPDVSEIPNYFLEDGYKRACWYLDNIDQEKFETQYRASVSNETVEYINDYSLWREYRVGGSGGLFDVKPGKRLTKSDQHEGETVFIGATKFSNGITEYIDADPLYCEPCITVNYNGSVGEAFYQDVPFWNSDDVKAWLPKFPFNKYIAMFLITVIKLQQQHYNYGVKWNQSAMEKTIIRLPSRENAMGEFEPDWDYMERYIKSLPYSVAI